MCKNRKVHKPANLSDLSDLSDLSETSVVAAIVLKFDGKCDDNIVQNAKVLL
jgi:hypothetical protein